MFALFLLQYLYFNFSLFDVSPNYLTNRLHHYFHFLDENDTQNIVLRDSKVVVLVLDTTSSNIVFRFP